MGSGPSASMPCKKSDRVTLFSNRPVALDRAVCQLAAKVGDGSLKIGQGAVGRQAHLRPRYGLAPRSIHSRNIDRSIGSCDRARPDIPAEGNPLAVTGPLNRVAPSPSQVAIKRRMNCA
jgi:hypothetical protein